MVRTESNSRTHDLPHDSPMLNQMSHRYCTCYDFRGSKRSTAVQQNKALHWEGLARDKLRSKQKQFLGALQESNTAGNELVAANRLFVQKDLSVEEFVEGTKRLYDAEIASVGYRKDAKGARKEFSEWVEQKTKSKIKNLIGEGVFNDKTRLTLVNAIYFKGFWQAKFDKKSTNRQKFFVAKSEKIQDDEIERRIQVLQDAFLWSA